MAEFVTPGQRRLPTPKGLPPLDVEGALWVAAINRVPIEERIEWVAAMVARVDEV